MSQTVEIVIDGVVKNAEIGLKISDVLRADMPCGGKGRCGKCKVLATGELSPVCESEIRHLTKDELEMGYRLACKCEILGKCQIISAKKAVKHQILTHGGNLDVDICPAFEKYGIAVDIGTTTLAASLYDPNGALLAANSDLNPQSAFGADVISRIEASMGGRSAELADAVRKAVNEMILSLCKSAKIKSTDVDSLVITGNTAMLYLLTGASPVALSRAPFIADKYFGECISAKELGISALDESAEIYLPPCIGAFVGADLVCAVLASKMCDKSESCLLADIGTNGEMALWQDNKLSVCSTAAGPAFEGVGISAGMRGAVGAIDRVSIVNGSLFCHVIGEAQPIGICGSGLIDAVAALLDLEILDETGYLEDDFVTLSGKICLTQQDVRMVQLAKSAIYSGISTLVSQNGASFEDMDALYIAGGFGNYLNMRSASRVGLIPSELESRIKVIGNAALAGASMILLNADMKTKAKTIAHNARIVELSSNPVFAELYMNNMMFLE